MEKSVLQSIILKWGKQNIKPYPWRFSCDPYIVLVSEFMLHRTKVNQVIPVFNNFMKIFPKLESINASDKEVFYQLLKPLGLNWRINNMFSALIEIKRNFHEVPLDLEILLRINGIGPYIAGATVCFSQNQPMPLIDTNIVRVIGRVCGLNLKGEARRRKEIKNSIVASVDQKFPREFYYSLIDLAHDICLPQEPDCSNCPLSCNNCAFYDNK